MYTKIIISVYIKNKGIGFMGRKKKENAKDVIVQGRIDLILNKSLESFCTASGMNTSEVIRSALEQFLK
jgi:hypothetical protein